jgi:hypothetical protein
MFLLSYILNEKSSWCWVQQVNSNELLFSKIIPEHTDTFIPSLHKFKKFIIKYVGLLHLQLFPTPHCETGNVKRSKQVSSSPLAAFTSVPICWADWSAHHGYLTILVLHTISVSNLIDCGKNKTVELCHKHCT